ncbi:Uncharacterised protein [Mycobacteroides abscessus subsp. abscessus]|nr:Uncharacterised protein [Mycobacteroides abscessus subsp. abscessus]
MSNKPAVNEPIRYQLDIPSRADCHRVRNLCGIFQISRFTNTRPQLPQITPHLDRLAIAIPLRVAHPATVTAYTEIARDTRVRLRSAR